MSQPQSHHIFSNILRRVKTPGRKEEGLTLTAGGCDRGCENQFLQSSLNMKNNGDVEEFYEVYMKLGAGTYGVVKLAKHRITGQKRAIKNIMKFSTSTEEQQQLENEMSILRKLSHPNILQLIEYFETDEMLYIVTDVYEGGELFDEIISRKEFKESDASLVIAQLLSCIAYCNEKRIVHRDIKPENIMLEKSKDLTAIKLIDFGHATKYNPKKDDYLTEKCGTPYYIAPEVLNHQYDHKCDVWSIGVITYILLSGLPPFNGHDNDEIFRKIKIGRFNFNAKPWELVSETSKDFVKLLLESDMTKRCDAKEALTHDFISSLPMRPRAKTRASRLTRIAKLGSRSRNDSGPIEILREDSTPVNDKIKLKSKRNKTLEVRKENEAVKNLRRFRCKNKLVQIVYAYIIAQCLPKKKREELAKVFKAWDKDHDGLLTAEEVENGLKKHAGRFCAHIDVKSLFNLMDQDKSGFVEYREFLLAATNPKTLMTTSNLTAVFNFLDADSNGFITVEELKLAVRSDLDFDDDSTVQEMVNEVDIDKDGMISKEEFFAIMSHA